MLTWPIIEPTCPFENRWWSTEPPNRGTGETIRRERIWNLLLQGPHTSHSQGLQSERKLQPFSPSGILISWKGHTLLSGTALRVCSCIKSLKSEETPEGGLISCSHSFIYSFSNLPGFRCSSAVLHRSNIHSVGGGGGGRGGEVGMGARCSVRK